MRIRRRLLRLAGHAALALAALAYLAPVLYMCSASLTPDEQVLALRGRAWWQVLLPVDASLQNYRDVLGGLRFGRYLLNSLIVTGATVVLGLVVNSLAGFALARLRWRGRDAVGLGAVALLVVPLEAIAVPLFFLVLQLGWYDTYRAQIVPFVAVPFSIYLFATFFRELPAELDEAARIDGASTWTIYWRIAVPLARPAFASVAILTFLLYWGAYLWPLMVTAGPEVRPLPVALGIFPGQHPVQWGDVMAFGTLMVLPVVIVFLAFQRWFVRGIAATGIKG